MLLENIINFESNLLILCTMMYINYVVCFVRADFFFKIENF